MVQSHIQLPGTSHCISSYKMAYLSHERRGHEGCPTGQWGVEPTHRGHASHTKWILFALERGKKQEGNMEEVTGAEDYH